MKKKGKYSKLKCDIILGSSGFIAQHFIKRNKIKNRIFFCIDKKLISYNKNYRFYKLNINDFSKLKKLFKNLTNKYSIDTIWHFAANSDISKSNFNIDIDYKDTFLTTFTILKIIQELNLKIENIFFSSSSAIYGDNEKLLKEDSVNLNTISHYGSMKLSSEAILSSFCHLNNINCKIFRFPNVIGPDMTHGLIFDLKKKISFNKKILKILGNGKQKKQYLHVNDLINAIFYIYKKDKKKFNIFNISAGDEGVTVKEIVNQFIKINNIFPKIFYGKNNFGWPGDIPKFKFNINKIKKLGWKATMDSKLAIKKTIYENLIVKK